jgi:hypothetical protein
MLNLHIFVLAAVRRFATRSVLLGLGRLSGLVRGPVGGLARLSRPWLSWYDTGWSWSLRESSGSHRNRSNGNISDFHFFSPWFSSQVENYGQLDQFRCWHHGVEMWPQNDHPRFAKTKTKTNRPYPKHVTAMKRASSRLLMTTNHWNGWKHPTAA